MLGEKMHTEKTALQRDRKKQTWVLAGRKNIPNLVRKFRDFFLNDWRWHLKII